MQKNPLKNLRNREIYITIWKLEGNKWRQKTKVRRSVRKTHMLSGEYSSQFPIERERERKKVKKRGGGGKTSRQAAASKRVREKPGLETISKPSMRGTRGEDKSWSCNKDTCARSHACMHACMQACAVGRSQCVGFFRCASSNAPPCAPRSSPSRGALGGPA